MPHGLTAANANGFPRHRAEIAALAEGHFQILAPVYAEQRGAADQTATPAAFADLRPAAVTGSNLAPSLQTINANPHNFQAAPLSAAKQSRRAGLQLRFPSLVPVEYARGVTKGQVMHSLGVQESITFQAGAYAAFADVHSMLGARNHRPM